MLNLLKTGPWSLVAIAAGLAGCTVHPAGEKQERASAAMLGKPFEKPIESRPALVLTENPTRDQLVEFALLNNADLEQRYWTWRAAIEQIPQDGTQSTNLNIAGGTTITRGHASWNSSTVTLGNDPMTDIKWPGKLDAAAKQTLENARAAGRRFVKAKFELRSQVLAASADYALTAELTRLEQTNGQLLEMTSMTTAARNRAGNGGQQDVLKASNEADLSRNDVANLQSQLVNQRATLNALLGRSPDAPLPTPADQPAARPVEYKDAELVALAAEHNPELAALADEIRGRHDGILLAQLQYVPDFNFSTGTDLAGVAQSILGQVTVPIFRYEALNAAIDQSEANLRASEAVRHQARTDLAAQVVVDITTLNDADRQLQLLEQTILPRAQRVVEIGRSSYETGHASLLDLLDGQRSLVGIQRLVANLKSVREKRLLDLETFTTLDLSDRHVKRTVAGL